MVHCTMVLFFSFVVVKIADSQNRNRIYERVSADDDIAPPPSNEIIFQIEVRKDIYGNGLALTTESGKITKAESCRAGEDRHCDNYPNNYKPLDDVGIVTVREKQLHFAISPQGKHLSANAKLIYDSKPATKVPVHAGTLEYMSDGAFVSFDNKGGCYSKSGVVYCY